MNNEISIHKYFAEFMFSLFCSLFAIVKPITQPTGFAAPILFVITAVCAFLILIQPKRSGIKGDFRVLLTTTIVVICLLVVDFLGRPNENTSEYLYDFFLYGVLSLFFISYIRNYKAVLYYFSIIAIINGIIYLPDPILNSYELSGGYMQFGFISMMPAFAGSVVMLFYFRKKWTVVFSIIFLISLFVFANKSAFLCALVLLATGYLLIRKGGKFSLSSIMVLIVMGLIIYFNLDKIISGGFDFATSIGFADSYSLRTFEALLAGADEMVVGTRYDVWDEAIAMFNQKKLFGWGVGWFEKFSEQPYPHNIFLEVMVEYGILGLILFSAIFIIAVIRMARIKDFEKKVFTIFVFILWFLPLSVSLTFWKVSFFWMFWFLCFSSNKSINKVRIYGM